MHVFLVRKGKLAAYIMLLCGIALAVLAVLYLGGGALEAITRPQYYPVRSVETTQKEVAVTFDTINTDWDISMVYGYLSRYNVKATFFVTGDFAAQYKQQIQIMVDSGYDVMNLSGSYRNLSNLSQSDFAGELSSSTDRIREISHLKPLAFRPPLGEISSKLIETAKSMGYITVGYKVNSESYKEMLPDRLADKMIGDITDGCIIRFRIGITTDTQALDLVLKYLTENNYKVVTLSEMLLRDNYEVDQTGLQKRINTP